MVNKLDLVLNVQAIDQQERLNVKFSCLSEHVRR